MDQNAKGAAMIKSLESFPEDWREQQLLGEFSQVVQQFYATKRYIESGHSLDAFSCMLQTMVHWARIVIIEQGMRPESLVWKQVRNHNMGVYKLYEELLTSSETIEQRVRLILLAAEFSMMSKLRSCTSLLLKVMNEREEPWSVEDLARHPKLQIVQADWTLLLGRLVKRNVIREVNIVSTETIELMEIRYVKAS